MVIVIDRWWLFGGGRQLWLDCITILLYETINVQLINVHKKSELFFDKILFLT